VVRSAPCARQIVGLRPKCSERRGTGSSPAPAYESEGQRFESSRAHQLLQGLLGHLSTSPSFSPSHELRTPLNAIIGFSEVLSERMFGELNEKQEEYLEDIYASGTHLLSLINDILDLSKIEAGRMELELTDFHLPTALDSALTLVREGAGRRGIALQMNVDNRLGQIQADERKVRQVVLNLLSNAIKFTPEGGRIEVAASPRDGSVEVSVSDTGVGIASEDQEAVFEEFRQVGDSGEEGGHGPWADPLPEVHRTSWRADMGEDPGGRGFDLHVHDPGAPWRVRRLNCGWCLLRWICGSGWSRRR
jgi:signal transduction histidine kinase